MFNKSDDSNDDAQACCKATAAIAQDIKDYFLGLPDPQLVLPKNILLFSRQAAFGLDRGTAHHRFMLLFCLHGEGSVIVDDHVARLKPGSALLVTPHQFHHYARFTGGKLLWLFLSFELDDAEELSSLRGRVLKITPFQFTCLRQLTERYVALRGKQVATPEITILTAILVEEFRTASAQSQEAKLAPSRSGPARSIIQDVARYVHLHATEAIRIPDIAKAVGYSESHLRARFYSLVGIGLGAYIRKLRLHRARTMMLSTELRLKEIAERCGYDSIYTFSRAFRQEMGESPSHYRQRGK